MCERGEKMPKQVSEPRPRFFCGAEIGVACEDHVYASHKAGRVRRAHAKSRRNHKKWRALVKGRDRRMVLRWPAPCWS